MHLVYDVNLIISLRRRVGDLLHDLPDIIHAVVGGGVNLYDIHAGAGGDGAADAALSAGTVLRGTFAVHRAGKNLCNRGFSGSSRPREQISMADALRLELVFQRSHDMILALHIREGVRSKFSV